MSTSRGGSSNNGGGVQTIPAGSRKMVQSLKEIVNCPEAEIYAMLKECNMDPNEAVNRLLSQDPFHEVKSKREKKKENKDTGDFRSRGGSSTSNRGSRGGAERYNGRGGSEAAALYGKPTYKKENGLNYNSNSLTQAHGNAGSNISRRSPALSDAATIENKKPTAGLMDSTPLVSQPSTGYQSSWVGVPGQVSMADIVKMGRPHNKASNAPNISHHNANHHNVQGPPASASNRFPEDHVSKVSEINTEPGVSSSPHVSTQDEWPPIEPSPAANIPSVSEPTAEPELHVDPSNLPFDRINRHSLADEVRPGDDGATEDLAANQVGSTSSSGRKMQEDSSRGTSLYENDLYGNMGSFQPHNHAYEHEEAEDVNISVSTVTANLQQLDMEEEHQLPSEGDGPSVVIPDHLQVQTADCSHLSFGSFGSGINSAFSGPLPSVPMKSNLEEAAKDADGSSVEHLGARNSDYYGEESLRNVSEANLFHRTGPSGVSYDSSSVSQPEALRPDSSEVSDRNQYGFPSSTPSYTFENAQQLNVAFSQQQTSSQMQNHAPFSSVMQQAYTNSSPSTLLAANVHPGRESDLQYSPFPATQSMPTKYGNTAASIGGSNISMPEALKTSGFSSAQPTSQNLSGTSVATAPALPQHVAMHPYSQPTLPLGPFANMIGYPFLPQSYTYMPSAFQQAFAGNSTYHQSLAAMLPQYKNSVSVSSLPQSAAVASGYGAFGSTTTIPGNFPMNPPSAPSGTALNYDDVLSSQYKDSSHLLSLQQGENSAMWLHGPGSRTMSAVPASTYYSFQGQNQQPAGFRQGQQPSQNYGTLGYPNFYHSQTGISLDHQQQNPRDGSLGGSQGQPKQSQQIWQNSY